MAEGFDSAGLQALDAALGSGDAAQIHAALLALDAGEQSWLAARLGQPAVDLLYKRTRRTRAAPRGRVVVLHGIMGAQLDSIEAGNSRRIWINPYHLFRGRIDHFRVAPDGSPADPAIRVVTAGMMFEYLALVAELAWHWQVAPFAFDWRLDIDLSADQLRDKIEAFAAGRPCHLVAHSMGGLVSRRFIQRHPKVWASMADPDGLKSGGRLVMLGTPNKGSYAVPKILTGEEKYVRWLDKLDREHDMGQILSIVDTFPGSYQMLPSSKVNSGDDHAALFDQASWGGLPVTQAALDKGRAFQEALDAVVEPDRMVYVAGYDQATPHRVRVVAPGRFVYQETPDGDGRVPHELGLLAGVPTYWVHEAHGDLPKNPRILEGIHDLLGKGTTDTMPREKPMARTTRVVDTTWHEAQVPPLPEEVERALAKSTRRGARKELVLDPLAEARFVGLLMQDGPPRALPTGGVDAGSVRTTGSKKAAAPVRLTIDVVWGDIVKVRADVYAAGSYEGVTPINALAALDRCVSAPKTPDADGVLASLIRRGSLTASLGDIKFFPWADPRHRERLVAVAGMGRPGTFGRPQLRQLSRALTGTIAVLPHVTQVATVVIGSGEGNLQLELAVEDMLIGMVDALAADDLKSPIERVTLVDRDFVRAHRLQRAVDGLARRANGERQVQLEVSKLRVGTGGQIDARFGHSLLGLAAAQGMHRSPTAGKKRTVAGLLDDIGDKHVRERVVELLTKAPREEDAAASPLELALARELPASRDRSGPRRASAPDAFATRVSFGWDGRNIVVTALSNTAVVPERPIGVDKKLVDELQASMTDPPEVRAAGLPSLFARLLLPREFRALLHDAPAIVVEVDREMARLQWEMLGDMLAPEGPALALRVPLARQLRTSYSPAPSADARRGRGLRALVIGDPGDPSRGESLPGARTEALQVAQLLRGSPKIDDVVVMIGAPGAPREAALAEVPAASRLDVLGELMRGGYDILHYCGHGDFDPDDPEAAGWVFKDGLLTSRELERVDLAPRLVVANACLSARTAESGGAGHLPRGEATLLPSLADEFFKRGVRQYVGTAWEISDAGAVMFAQELYARLLGSAPLALGQALLETRQKLAPQERHFGALWAAYQHYGDPNFRLIESSRRS